MRSGGPTYGLESDRPVSEDVRNPFFARLYHHVLARGEGEAMVACRRQLVSGLSGTVLEIGPGDGPNFALYPDSVTEVVAVEPEPYLREQASRSAQRSVSDIRVVSGTAARLPVEDGAVDVVCVRVNDTDPGFD